MGRSGRHRTGAAEVTHAPTTINAAFSFLSHSLQAILSLAIWDERARFWQAPAIRPSKCTMTADPPGFATLAIACGARPPSGRPGASGGVTGPGHNT
jgi:hypothetical protein